MLKWRRGKELLAPPFSYSTDTFLELIASGQLVPYEDIGAQWRPDPTEPKGLGRVMPTYELKKQYDRLYHARYQYDHVQKTLSDYVHYTNNVGHGSKPCSREYFEQELQEWADLIPSLDAELAPEKIWRFLLELIPKRRDEWLERLLEASYEVKPPEEFKVSNNPMSDREREWKTAELKAHMIKSDNPHFTAKEIADLLIATKGIWIPGDAPSRTTIVKRINSWNLGLAKGRPRK
jgi:hypothetical protein